MNAIQFSDVHFSYGTGNPVFNGIHLKIPAGEKVFLHGPSGSGKSTLISLIAGILRPLSGEISILGSALSGMRERDKDRFRGSHIGYIFQQFNLIPYLNVRENILLPLNLSGKKPVAGEPEKLAEKLQIDSLLQRRAADISVGQAQRVAVARAMIHRPEIILADEPTSSLDAASRDSFLDLLLGIAIETSPTILFVSHDLSLSSHFERTVSIPELSVK